MVGQEARCPPSGEARARGMNYAASHTRLRARQAPALAASAIRVTCRLSDCVGLGQLASTLPDRMRGARYGRQTRFASSSIERRSPQLSLHLLGASSFAQRGSRDRYLTHRSGPGVLALNEGWQLRAQVAGTLWPDANDVRANASLRTALWRLRCVSSSVVEAPGNTRIVRAGGGRCPRADAIARRAMGRPVAEDRRRSGSSSMGELLPGWFDDWVPAPRATRQPDSTRSRVRAHDRSGHGTSPRRSMGMPPRRGALRESAHGARASIPRRGEPQ